MRRSARFVPAAATLLVLPLLLLVGWMIGCASVAKPGASSKQRLRPGVRALDVCGLAQPLATGGPVALYGARNEWVS